MMMECSGEKKKLHLGGERRLPRRSPEWCLDWALAADHQPRTSSRLFRERARHQINGFSGTAGQDRRYLSNQVAEEEALPARYKEAHLMLAVRPRDRVRQIDSQDLTQ